MKTLKRLTAALLLAAVVLALPIATAPAQAADDPEYLFLDKAVIKADKLIHIFFSESTVRNSGGCRARVCIVDNATDMNILKNESNVLLEWGGGVDNVDYPYSPMKFTMSGSITIGGAAVNTLSGIMALVEPGGAFEGKTVMFCMREVAYNATVDGKLIQTVKGNGRVDTFYAGNANLRHSERSIKANHVSADGFDEVMVPLVPSETTLEKVVQVEPKTLLTYFSALTVRNKGARARVCIVDNETDLNILTDTAGHLLEWGGGMDNVRYPYSPMKYNLSGSINVNDTTTVNTIDGIFALVAPGGLYEGKKVMFCLREITVGASAAPVVTVQGNGYVDTYYEGDGTVIYPDRPVKANHVSADGFDEVFVPVTQPSMTMDEVFCYGDNTLVMQFSEPVHKTGTYISVVRLVNAAGVPQTNPDTSALYEWPVSTGALSFYGVPGGESGDRLIGTLSGATMSEIRALAESKGLSVRFCIQETAGTTGVYANSYCVENIRGVLSGEGLWASRKGSPDAAYAEITDVTESVTITEAKVVGRDSVQVTFSQPVSLEEYVSLADRNTYIGLRICDASSPVLSDGGVTYQWRCPLSPTSDPCVFVGKMSVFTAGLRNISDIIALTEAGGLFEGKELVFAVEQSIVSGTSHIPGFVDNIVGTGSNRAVLASNRSYDATDRCYTELTYLSGEPELLSAVAINETQIVATFSEPVDIDPTPWVGIRMVNDSDTLVFDSGTYGTGTPMQWYGTTTTLGTWEWYDDGHTQIIWTMKPNNTYGICNLSDLINGVNISSFSGYTIKFGMEEKTGTGLEVNKNNDVVDNITSQDSFRAVGGTCTNSAMLDAVYVPITAGFDTTPLTVSEVEQLDESSLLVTFSAPIAITEGGVHTSLRLVDANNNLAWDGAVNTGTPMQWYGVREWYDEAHTQIKWTLSGNGSQPGIGNLTDLFAYKGIESFSNYTFKFCIQEYRMEGVSTDSNALVDNISAVGEPVKLLNCNKKGALDGNYTEITRLIYDTSELGVKKIDVKSDSQLVVTFTEPVEIRGDLWTGFRLVDDAGRLQAYNNGNSWLQWKGRWEYTDESHTAILWTINANVPLGMKSIGDILMRKDRLSPWQGDDMHIMFCIEEKSTDDFTVTTANGLVDSLKAANRVKCASANPYLTGWNDGIYTEVTGACPTARLEAVSAEIISDTRIVVTFSAPISLNSETYAAVRLVDADNVDSLRWTGGSYGKGRAIQWGGKLEYYNEEHTQLVCTLYGNSTFGIANLNDILAMKNFPEEFKKYTLKFCLEEKGAEHMILGNNHIDNITLAADPRVHLTAGKPIEGGRDCTYLAIEGTDKDISPVRSWAEILNDRQMVISFSDTVRIDGNPFIAIRYIKDNALVWSGEKDVSTPLQFYGTWEWYNDAHTRILWTMNGSNTYGANNIYDVVNYANGCIGFKDAVPVMCIEENTKDGFKNKISYNQLVDNIIAWDSQSHLYANTSTGNDAIFMRFDTAPLLGNQLQVTKVTAVDDMTLEVKFSAPVEIADGAKSPSMAIRYLTETGDTDVAVDGLLSIFKGNWKWKDDKHDTIIWTLDPAAAHGATNLSDIFNYEGNLRFSSGSVIAFCIIPNEDSAIGTWNMRIDGITDKDGIMTLSATRIGELSMVQIPIAVAYELPEPTASPQTPLPGGDEEEEETITLHKENYVPAYLIGGGLAVAGTGVGIAAGLGKRKKRIG